MIKQPQPKPPVIGTESVKCACGHEWTFELFALKKDKYRDARRAKFAKRRCPRCRQEDEAARVTAAKKNRKPSKFWNLKSERLPDGANFNVTYDATTQTWSGTLTIQGTPIQDSHSEVFKLLRMLDLKYRDLMEATEKQKDGLAMGNEICDTHAVQ